MDMLLPLKYHEGEIAVQKRAGAFDPAELDGNGLGTAFGPRETLFLAEQPWVVIAALDNVGRVWSSVLHGSAGFLRVDEPGLLAVQASLPAGDPLSASLGSMNEIGMLVLDPRTRRRTRINGRARRANDGMLLVATREVYGNCPKYIQRRELADSVPGKAGDAVVTPALTAEQREQIARADTFFIGSIHAEAGIDCSHRGGAPGFVHALDERRLAFPDYTGNNMFQTLGNLSLDARAGLLFIDFERGHTLQLTGTATVVWEPGRLREWTGAQRVIEFQLAEVVSRQNAIPLRWRFVDYSPFNPA